MRPCSPTVVGLSGRRPDWDRDPNRPRSQTVVMPIGEPFAVEAERELAECLVGGEWWCAPRDSNPEPVD